jgi:hypothetical protein
LLHNRIFTLCYLVLSLLPGVSRAVTWVDAHVHYDTDDVQQYSPLDIINLFDKNSIERAVVTSMPPALTQTLYKFAPDRIIPMLGVYQASEDKQNWYTDPVIPDRIKNALEHDTWKAIGELHLFAQNRHSPVFHEIIMLAAQHKIPLLLHADPAVIDTAFEVNPDITIVWAHAGTYPYPDLVADYLRRYPNLYVDLSMREGRIAPQGEITDDWYELLVTLPDRFMVAVDTYSAERWRQYSSAVKQINGWLNQLPEEVEQNLRSKNARRVYLADRD